MVKKPRQATVRRTPHRKGFSGRGRSVTLVVVVDCIDARIASKATFHVFSIASTDVPSSRSKCPAERLGTPPDEPYRNAACFD